MKLMKKNSSIHSAKPKIGSQVKIDWSKITDKTSSVHSEELNYKSKEVSGGDIDEICNLKKKVKEFEA